MSSNNFVLLGLLICFCSCQKTVLLFEEKPTSETGVNFINRVQDSDELNILDYLYFYNGAGVAAGDVNNDGLIDLFFVSNLESNKLYLNKGNLQFDDVSQQAHIQGNSSWNTGVSMVDINHDGWLDIYVCAVVGIHGFMGHNELYINQQDGTFKEEAKSYGLDIQSYATSAAFFDYDQDGDLDMYLLNHGIHNTSNYLGESTRNSFNKMSSDKLYKNENGFFTDVTKEANLFGGNAGYGLAVSVSDLNGDNWDDLYISNDFYENDYLYINQKDGTFKEKIRQSMSQTSQFSMGNDISDINHDGLADIITLDMLPEDEKVLKSSLGEISYNSLIQRRSLGYTDQFSRNHLQINSGNQKFLEIGLFSGISATDWSWAAALADFDNDGFKDAAISTGIYRRPNDADYIKYISSDQIKTKINNTRLVDYLALEKMPRGDIKNYFFKGNKDLRFSNMSDTWIRQEPGLSNGMVSADLDNDGDLDLVFNNFNNPASILENTLDKENSSIKITFGGPSKNPFGIGTKIFVYAEKTLFFEQLHTTRGFLSSFPQEVHIGLGTKSIDSIKVIWPDQKTELLSEIDGTNHYIFDYRNAILSKKSTEAKKNPFFKEVKSFKIQHTVGENNFPEFNREKLMPYGVTEEGSPLIATDVNNDNVDDLFVGGAKGFPSALFLSTTSGYVKSSTETFEKDKKYEDVDAIFTDIDSDSDLDLFVVSGGGEYIGKSEFNKDRVYLNDGNGNFKLAENILPEYYHTGAVIVGDDFDKDGDEDYFIGSRVINNSFGVAPKSFLLRNENGKLHFDSRWQTSSVGMVKDAIFTDVDGDKDNDLIVVAEWSEIKVFENNNGDFIDITNALFETNPKGLWQSVTVFDIDRDGVNEIIVGNVGLNTKFEASYDYPLKMYVADFDNNGQVESVVAVAKDEKYFTIDSKDKMEGQMPELIRRNFNSYKEFAGKSIDQIFGLTLLSKANLFLAEELQSGYFKKIENKYHFFPFPLDFQWGPISKMISIDKNNSPYLILTGAKHNLPPYQGKWSSQKHLLLKTIDDFKVLQEQGIDLRHKQVTDFVEIKQRNSVLLGIGVANQKIKFYSY